MFQKIKSSKGPERMKTRHPALDEVFGGGIVKGSVITLVGMPGSGKTSLAAQIAQELKSRCCFASGEESLEQLGTNFQRLGVFDVPISDDCSLEFLTKEMPNYDFMVVDSYQKVRTSKKFRSASERIQYVRETLIQSAKDTGCSLIIICHINKAGEMKGTTDLPHDVDMNILLKVNGSERIVEVSKNRFGSSGSFSFPFGSSGYVFEKKTKLDISPDILFSLAEVKFGKRKVDIARKLFKFVESHSGLIKNQLKMKV